jgi:23S rRNA pseudouridine1911/1915/1917 synthase
MNNFTVSLEKAGERLDSFLSAELNDISRSKIQTMIKDGKVLLNSKPAKPSSILKENDSITYEIVEELQDLPLPERGDINIIYENNDFMIVDKPANLVVHPAHANKNHTLVNYLLAMRPEISSAVYDPSKSISLERPGIVHRLDKDTSGLIIIAKTSNSMQKLSKIIHDHKLSKNYTALTYGWIKEKGVIKSYLRRSEQDRRKMVTHPKQGKESITEYKVLKYFKYKASRLSMVSLTPITGRTHQLRVHLKSIGHPVLGDKIYSNNNNNLLSEKLNISRQLLHASCLKFRYNGKDYEFTSDMPADITSVINKVEEIND